MFNLLHSIGERSSGKYQTSKGRRLAAFLISSNSTRTLRGERP
nr:MAG TPA: hypothetical protein [Caudoviricetes sp.]